MFVVTVCVPFSTLDTRDRRSQLCTFVNTVNSVGEHVNFLAGDKKVQELLCVFIYDYIYTYKYIHMVWFQDKDDHFLNAPFQATLTSNFHY